MSFVASPPKRWSRESHTWERSKSRRSTELGEHALQLLVQIQKRQPRGMPGWWIFQLLSRMVASCVFFDCVRNGEGGANGSFVDYYKPSLELMLQDFCNLYWPCSFVDRSGRRCADTKAKHDPKQHRSLQGKQLGPGGYETDFTAASYRQQWIGNLTREIDAIRQDFKQMLGERPSETSRRTTASDLHLELTNEFYADLLGATTDYKSHTSCFCCLTSLPLHPLPCGHVLCGACVRDFGKLRHGRMSVTLDYCPLHTRTKFAPPWEVGLMIEHAGVRILCLDGGGMRGMVELEVLRAIEKALGGEIAVQSFFDLIVGTSTGGINALALGIKQWPVKYCISVFEKFCDQAFTERELRGVWGLQQAAVLNHGSVYKAKPLHNALRDTLGSKPLFGGNDSLNAYRTKVAVTATSGNGKEAVIIANYNRPQDPADSHIFVRPDDASNEFEVWEAAAATSAAPFYFKPFVHSKTGESYLDGALYHNNPVHVANRERKLLWPDVAATHPDMLLSIGTGQNIAEMVAETSEQRTPKASEQKKSESRTKSPARRPSRLWRTFETFEALYQRFDNILDSEQTWTDFEADVNNQNTGFPSPYIRFNLDLHQKLPPFDAKDKLRELRKEARERLNDPAAMVEIHHIARMLVASSFYLKLKQVVTCQAGKHVCSGEIKCKFAEASSNLRALGAFLQRCQTSRFRPYFSIQETSRCSPDQGVKVELTDRILAMMATYGMFQAPTCNIEVTNPMATTVISLILDRSHGCDQPQQYVLSGFPRTLVKEVPLEKTANGDDRTRPPPVPRREEIPTSASDSRTRHEKYDRPTSSHEMPSQTHVNRTERPSRPEYTAHRSSRHDSALQLPESLRIINPPQQRRSSHNTTGNHRATSNHASTPQDAGPAYRQRSPEHILEQYEQQRSGRRDSAGRSRTEHIAESQNLRQTEMEKMRRLLQSAELKSRDDIYRGSLDRGHRRGDSRHRRNRNSR